MKKLYLFSILGLILVGGAFIWNKINNVQAVDLGVIPSNAALSSFFDKIGPRSHGIVAGGIPVGSSFSNEEFTSFLALVAKEHKLPIGNTQVRFHDDTFEASVVIHKFVKGDLYMKGSIQLKESRKVYISIYELQSKTISISTEMKKKIEQELNQGIQDLFDRYGPDDRFLSIQTLQLEENKLVVEGIFPLEFFPDSKIRF